MKLIPSIAVSVAMAASAGCGKTYVAAQVRFSEVPGRPAPRDVRRTMNYPMLVRTFRTVAFRAPDTCFQQAAGATLILTTECAVWLAELERAVAVAGYRVVSWDALLQAERTGGGPVHEAARRLGVDLVFILHGLETRTTKPTSELAVAINYLRSDEYGELKGEYLLDDAQRRALADYIRQRVRVEDHQQSMRTLSVALNSTAVLASTGESVWYYRWSVSRTLGTQPGVDFLFRGRDQFWRPVLPLGSERAAREASRSMSSQQVLTAGAASRPDDYGPALSGLVQRVSKDFVSNFRGEGS